MFSIRWNKLSAHIGIGDRKFHYSASFPSLDNDFGKTTIGNLQNGYLQCKILNIYWKVCSAKWFCAWVLTKKHRPVLETTCYGCTQCLPSCIWFWRSFCWDTTHHKSKPGPERRWVTDCMGTASLHTVLWHKLCPKYFYFKLFMYTPFGWSHLWEAKNNHGLTGRQCLVVNAYLCLFLTDLFLCLQTRNTLFVCSVPTTATEETIKTHFMWADWFSLSIFSVVEFWFSSWSRYSTIVATILCFLTHEILSFFFQ